MTEPAEVTEDVTHGVTDASGEQFELVSGWGRTPVSASRVVRAATRDDLASAGKAAPSRSGWTQLARVEALRG